ncbi:hypothetical protein K440107A6_39600 [Lawsonibacter asaccharolyticus]
MPLYHLGRHFPGLAVGEERFPLASGAGPRDDQRRRTGRSAVPGAEGAVRQIWGPAVTGILAGMPMLVLSAVLLVRKGSWRKSW